MSGTKNAVISVLLLALGAAAVAIMANYESIIGPSGHGLGSDGCPDGAHIAGAAPPDGTSRGCMFKDKDGNLIRHGHWVEWYLNGQKLKEGDFYNGLRRGAWTWWYPTGQKMQHGYFNDDRAAGTWTYWDENGHETAEPSAGAEVADSTRLTTPVQDSRSRTIPAAERGPGAPGLDTFSKSLQKNFNGQ